MASRLTELYYRPSVVMAINNDMVTGSARSVAGFDIYAAIESCKDLLKLLEDTLMQQDCH